MRASGSGVRAYLIVWAGQFLSLLGSGLTGFALGVYVYRLTGSATTLGLIFALGLLPAILVSPFTGALVDRWGVKRSLLVSNSAHMAITLVLAALLATDTFAVWHVYPIVVATSVVAALELPAFGALAPMLVHPDQLGRVNGLRMLAMATSEVLTPVTAGFLILAIGIDGIVLIDFASFGLAILSVAVVRIPRAAPPAEPPADGRRSLLADFRQGWRYIAARPGLLALLVFLGAVNFSAGFIDLLITPLVLAFASADALGVVLSVGGVGMVVTSLAVSVWGGPRRRVRGVLGFSLVLAGATVLGSARPNVALVAVAAFVFMGALGIIISTNQAIWQSKVEPHMMGRAIAIVTMVAQAPQLVAYAVAGVAVDRVFEPLVGHDDVRSPVLATLVGDGPGRGIALLMMVVGALIAVSVAVAALNPRLRGLEDELPDVARQPDEPVPEPVADRV
jgi:DHA3 family macrolide efflux protein-like MFS transporter